MPFSPVTPTCRLIRRLLPTARARARVRAISAVQPGFDPIGHHKPLTALNFLLMLRRAARQTNHKVPRSLPGLTIHSMSPMFGCGALSICACAQFSVQSVAGARPDSRTGWSHTTHEQAGCAAGQRVQCIRQVSDAERVLRAAQMRSPGAQISFVRPSSEPKPPGRGRSSSTPSRPDGHLVQVTSAPSPGGWARSPCLPLLAAAVGDQRHTE